MKKLVCMMLASCMVMTSASAIGVQNSGQTVQSNYGNQPINRQMLDKNTAPDTQISQQEAVYDDPYLSYQWAISQINADLAWAQTTQSKSVMVAVIDTGVDYTHEDLENRVLVELGYDFVNDDTDAMDDNGHGTHVAGIIAAEADNGVGIAGITGTLDVSILPIKALNAAGEGNTEDIADAILYAVEMGADIINLSLGADVATTEVRNAIETALAADIFVVVAAGNDGTVCTDSSLANISGVFTVSASTASNTIADFANYGSCVDVYAPGETILSTYLDNQYAFQDGTSMAAPIVSGAAAILLSQDSTLTVAELTALLSDTDTQTTTTVSAPMVSNTPPRP